MKFYKALIIIPLLFFISCKQANIIEIKLSSQPVQENRGPRWSPKGEKLELTEKDNGLETKLQLGTLSANTWAIRMTRTDGSQYYNTLYIDHNQNNVFEDLEMIRIQPSESRGKIWSSFNGVLNIKVTDPWSGKKSYNTYPLSFWYVFNPKTDKHEKVLRFSRRGWMEGSAVIEGVVANVLLTESLMDGIIDISDSWALAPKADLKELYDYRNARSITEHAWLNEKAYKIVNVHPSGRKLVIKAYDPGITREEEAVKMDIYAPDKNAAHSGGKVKFGHDFKIAKETAGKENKNLFIDFDAVWCGPCKLMDKIVYNADVVVKASENVIAVKVDGDEHPELVKRFEVTGYPTLILVSTEGKIIKKSSGYQSVKQTVAFLETIVMNKKKQMLS